MTTETAEVRFCVQGPNCIIHEMLADDATDQGLDVERIYCPTHDDDLCEGCFKPLNGAIRLHPACARNAW